MVYYSLYKRLLRSRLTFWDRYVCTICGYVYDEEAGDPDNGFALETKWADVPNGYVLYVVPQKKVLNVDKMSFRKEE